MADMRSLFRVDGLVAVISGGGTGIGLMMAKALAENGAAKVYIIGRRLDKLEEAAKHFSHRIIIPLQGDVTSKESLESVVAHVKAETGYVNLLVCNSGVTGPLIETMPSNPSLQQIREFMWAWKQEDFNSTFALNDTAAFFTVIAFLELLDAGNKAKNRAGIQSSVLITASVAAMTRQIHTGVAYITSKAAALHMAKMLSTYFAPHGIRVNSLCPGIFPSEMTQGHIGASAGFSTATIPEGRAGSEDDIAGTILYMASRAGAYLNGMAMLLDGGRLSQLPATY